MSSTAQDGKEFLLILARSVEPNRGDVLSRYGLLKALFERLPHVHLAAVSQRPQGELPPGCRVLPPGYVKNLIPTREERRLFREYRCLVLWTCGHDYADDGSPFKAMHAAMRAVVCKCFGVPFWVVAQGAGPIRRPVTRWAVRLLGATASRLFFRDPESLALIKTIVRPRDFYKLSLTADSALLAPPEAVGDEAGQASTPPVVGINVRQWFHLSHGFLPLAVRSRLPFGGKPAGLDDRMKTLLENLARLADHCIETYGATIKFIPMYPPCSEDWEMDEPYSLLVMGMMRHPGQASVLDMDLSPEALIGQFCALSAMVGVRLHSTVLATACRVPSLHIAYSPKGRSYFKMLGEERFILDIAPTSEERGLAPLIAAFDTLWHERREYRGRLARKSGEIRTLAMVPVNALAEFCNKRSESSG